MHGYAPKTDSETSQQQCRQLTPPCSIARLAIQWGIGVSSLIFPVRVPRVVSMIMVTFVLVFVYMRDIGADVGADGCNSRTRQAWLSEHSQG